MFNNIPLSHEQKQLILGSLLGDGYCNKERQFLRFLQCLKQKEYLNYKYSFFNSNEIYGIYKRNYKEGYIGYSFEFPNIKHDREYYEKLYPERNLPEGAMVTRYGPSPTGSVHLGNLYSAFCVSQEVIPYMIHEKHGCIINI